MSLKWCKYRSSYVEDFKCENCEDIKKCSASIKSAETINKKNEQDPNKIKHFGVWFDKDNPNLKINREHYALFGEKELATWSWETCQKHQDKCLINFDKNMHFFQQLDFEEFNNMLETIIVKDWGCVKISDLFDCDGMCGLYVMVLGEYKQVYVGKATNIKRRISQHWRNKKEFNRLLWGNVNNSVLSIDSFGPLDTTAVYILPISDKNSLDYLEDLFVSAIPDDYKLNRIGGGGLYSAFDVLSTMHFRDLDRTIEKKEKCQEEIEYIKFSKSRDINIENLQIGDVVFIQAMLKAQKGAKEYCGKIINITKNYITIIQYVESENSKILKTKLQKINNGKYSYQIEKKLSKHTVKSVWMATSEIVIKKRTRYRKQ